MPDSEKGMGIKMKVIVSGATGFIGSSVVKELLTCGHEVLAIGRRKEFSRYDSYSNYSYIECELNEIKKLSSILTDNNYDIFYHFAWDGSAGSERFDTVLQLNNVQWTIDALNVARKLGCTRFVGAGSITEYETLYSSYKDASRPPLGYIYGGAKVAAHSMAMAVAANIGIELIWGMITNAYGIGEYSSRLINSTIRNCINRINPQFTSGTQNYDFIYIDDVARAFRMIGEKGRAFHQYVIGSSQAKPLKDFMLEMKEAIVPDLDFYFGDVPFLGVNMPLSTFDCTSIEMDTGFQANISFTQGCQLTYNWWKKILAGDCNGTTI